MVGSGLTEGPLGCNQSPKVKPLVAMLRGGVMESFVTTLSGKDPVVEVKMKGDYAPNVYVSVLAVRGRVAGWRLWLAAGRG